MNTIILDDIIDIISGGTPKTSNPEFWGGNIPWLSVKDFNNDNRYVYKTEKSITELGLNHSAATLLQKDDIVLSARGTVGAITMVPFPMTFNQSCYGLRAKEGFDQTYLYYCVKNAVEKLKHITHGSVFDTITRDTFRSIEVVIHSYKEQKAIADILSNLDNKIELNNHINQNLEEQAKTIYKAWFIDKIPFEGLTPCSWIETTLGEVCSCELGGTPSRSMPEYWDGNIPWINSGEINRFRITNPSETITEIGLSKSSTKLLPAKTTVIAITGATLGQVSLLEIDSCANQSVVGVVPNEQLPYEFIYPFINANIQELITHQTGGAQQHINKQNVEGLTIVVPSPEVMGEYVSLVSGIYGKIALNCFENERLISIRDALLPKLMSGEIEVSSIDL